MKSKLSSTFKASRTKFKEKERNLSTSYATIDEKKKKGVRNNQFLLTEDMRWLKPLDDVPRIIFEFNEPAILHSEVFSSLCFRLHP